MSHSADGSCCAPAPSSGAKNTSGVSLAANLSSANHGKTEEEELEELFDDIDIPAEIRDARYAAVKDYQKYASVGGGEYTEITEEREVLETTARETRCVVHFMHPNFRRCEIMKTHLQKIAAQHFKTRFYCFNAEKGRWIAEKLKIQALPTVICFIDAKVVDRIVGFDELGNTDEFDTKLVEDRLAACGVIEVGGSAAAASNKIFGFASKAHVAQDSDSDSD